MKKYMKLFSSLLLRSGLLSGEKKVSSGSMAGIVLATMLGCYSHVYVMRHGGIASFFPKDVALEDPQVCLITLSPDRSRIMAVSIDSGRLKGLRDMRRVDVNDVRSRTLFDNVVRKITVPEENIPTDYFPVKPTFEYPYGKGSDEKGVFYFDGKDATTCNVEDWAVTICDSIGLETIVWGLGA